MRTMHNEQALLEGIDAALERHGLMETEELDEAAGVFSAFHSAFKANPALQKQLTDAAVDGMVRALKAEAKKYKGHLGGWREEIRIGLNNRKNLDAFRNMARGLVDKAALGVVRKLIEGDELSDAGAISEASKPESASVYATRATIQLNAARDACTRALVDIKGKGGVASRAYAVYQKARGALDKGLRGAYDAEEMLQKIER